MSKREQTGVWKLKVDPKTKLPYWVGGYDGHDGKYAIGECMNVNPYCFEPGTILKVLPPRTPAPPSAESEP